MLYDTETTRKRLQMIAKEYIQPTTTSGERARISLSKHSEQNTLRYRCDIFPKAWTTGRREVSPPNARRFASQLNEVADAIDGEHLPGSAKR